jgi:hypothetical protein
MNYTDEKILVCENAHILYFLVIISLYISIILLELSRYNKKNNKLLSCLMKNIHGIFRFVIFFHMLNNFKRESNILKFK